jgi:hypothetical protein
MDKGRFWWFVAGIAFYANAIGLWQDLIGKERYLALVAKGWIDSRYTAPVEGAILFFLLCQIWKGMVDFGREVIDEKNKKEGK